jgi:tetratricopeptide (TPR) repeat protein
MPLRTIGRVMAAGPPPKARRHDFANMKITARRLWRFRADTKKPASWTVAEQARDNSSVEAQRTSNYPSLSELRALLIPSEGENQWDRGELPRAIFNLDNQSALSQCHLLLRLACVVRRSLDETKESRIVALKETLLDLVPKELDHPCCQVLRVLAGLEPGTAGRGREQRQQVAGSRLGSERQPASTRTVRRFVKQRCWPWLLDRLIEREVSERKAGAADERESPWTARVSPLVLASNVATPLEQLPVAIHGRLVPIAASRTRPKVAAAGVQPTPKAHTLWTLFEGASEEVSLCCVIPELSPQEWAKLEDDVKRRTLLLGVPAAWLLSQTRLRQPFWSRVEAGTLNVDSLDELAAAVASDKRLHDRLGSRAAYGSITEHVRLSTDLLRGSPPAAMRSRLAAIASEAAGEAGLVCRDQRQFQIAQSYHRLATELAQEADDHLLGAHEFGVWSRTLTEAGNGTEAILLLERARALASSGNSPATWAYLAQCEAEAHASVGDVQACLRALDRVDEAFAASERGEDPAWLYWLSPAMVAGAKGRSYRHVGRLAEAESMLTLALSAWDSSFVRDRAIYLIDLAFVRASQGEPEECCRVAEEALEIAIASRSPRLVGRIQDLRGDLQPWSDSPAVKVLDEHLVTAGWI